MVDTVDQPAKNTTSEGEFLGQPKRSSCCLKIQISSSYAQVDNVRQVVAGPLPTLDPCG